jgi:predicted ester cyclase
VANPEPYRGKEGVRQFMQAWMTAFPNLSAHLKSRVVSEDTVADEIEFSGTNSGPLQMAPGMPAIPATGKTVSNGKGTYFVHVRDGKIVEFNSYPDVAGMMMELGLMPGPKA